MFAVAAWAGIGFNFLLTPKNRMTLKSWRYPWLMAVVSLAFLPSVASAKKEEWTDPQGKKFKGEPSAILGPLAVFRTGLTTMQRFPLHFLSEADCVRFAAQLSAQPSRAQDWAQAKSLISSELVGNVLRVQNGKLISADLKGQIEPEFYIIFYASNGVGESWGMMGSAIWKFQEMQKQFPGLVEGLFVGLAHSSAEHKNMAISSKLPWLVTDFYEQSRMGTIMRLGPERAPLLLIVTREGVPMFATSETEAAKIGEVLDQLTGLLKLMQPENPQALPDRAHYLRAVQLGSHRTGEAAPVLLVPPLRVEVLKKHGVKSFTATLTVSREGAVTAVVIQAGAEMPEKMSKPITDTLTKALVIPAVKDGQFVDGTYEYRFLAATEN